MADGGWIKLHRKFLNWEWSDSPEVVALFVHLLLESNHEDRKWHGQTIERGQIVTSRDKLSKLTGLSIQQVRTCLARMEQTGEISRKTTNKFTLITISNYARYQSNDDAEQPTTNQQLTNNQPTTNKQITTNKNIKKNKKERIDNNIPDGMCPTEPSDADAEDKDTLTNRHCQNIVDFWNKTVDETKSTLPHVAALSDARKKKMRIRWKEFTKLGDPVEVCRTIFQKVCTSKFCQGDNKNGWTASFDWIFSSGNWTKVYEGNYDDRPVSQEPHGFRPAAQGAGRVANAINTYNEVENWIHGRFSETGADCAPDSQLQQ